MYHISFWECALGTRNVQLMHIHCRFAFLQLQIVQFVTTFELLLIVVDLLYKSK